MDTDKILENSARAFEVVAREIQRYGLSTESHSLTIASSVNAGLAIEFYAKCLSQIVVGQYAHTHDLAIVLAQLPKTLKSDLCKAFSDSVTDAMRNDVRRVAAESGVTIGFDFDSVIANWSRVFVDGRYWFEGVADTSRPALHWFFFDELVNIMKIAIEQQRPSQNA